MQAEKEHESMSKWLIGFVDWSLKLVLVGILSMLYSIDKKIDAQNNEIATLKTEVALIKNEMVRWDVLTRMERTLALLSSTGKGNQAMSAVADVIRTERESRDQRK